MELNHKCRIGLMNVHRSARMAQKKGPSPQGRAAGGGQKGFLAAGRGEGMRSVKAQMAG